MCKSHDISKDNKGSKSSKPGLFKVDDKIPNETSTLKMTKNNRTISKSSEKKKNTYLQVAWLL